MKTLLAALSALVVLSSNADTKYMIVVDGGSTSSRLYLYSYDQSSLGAIPTNIKTVVTTKATPGLQEINSANIPEYLTSLFSGIAKTTAAPVYFYTTASMRIVSPTIQDADYQTISKWIRQNTQAKVADIRTIPGSEEAFFDWVADNTLRNNFQNNQNLQGILDMGGGSMEIAYPSDKDDPRTIPFNFNGQTIYVHAESYLGLGLDYSRYQFSTNKSCFPTDFPMPNGKKGMGSVDQCEDDVQSLITLHRVEPQPVNKLKFDAFAGFYHVSQPLMQRPGNFNLDLDAYQEVATSFCADDWNTILSNLKYVSGKDYLYTYCYAASEEIQLLKSLGFDATQNNITAVDKINGQTVDWAFGVLIEKAGSQTP